jgi:gamma-glutamyltranspeptidase/glutathione hydrolase
MTDAATAQQASQQAPAPQQFTLRKPVVIARDGVVVANHAGAARLGAAVLAHGGNAVDAAVTTSFAVSVLEPWMSGLGGGGHMLVYSAATGQAQAIDFAMPAPQGLDPADYPIIGAARDNDLFGWPAVADSRNIKGGTAIAVPGQVAGMALALREFGSIDWAMALAPAVALAEAGLPVDWHSGLIIANHAPLLAEFPATAATFLPGGLPPVIDDGTGLRRLPLPRLARTLRHLAEAGPEAFYRGPLADSIIRDVQAAGGCLQAADLADYAAQIREPLAVDYRGARLALAPHLTAGPTLAGILRKLDDDPLRGSKPDAGSYARYARLLQEAYAERLATMGTTDDSAAPGSTTQICVIDRDGNMVALTQTLLSLFGGRVVLPDSGILMNNGIMWFDPRPGRPNSMQPSRRPLTNMCPVLATRDGAPWFALGASGGRKIMPAVLQIISFLADFEMSLEAAFHQPRIDASGGGRITCDPRLGSATRDALAAVAPVDWGEATILPRRYATPSAVLRDPGDGRFHAMNEVTSPFGGGAAAD